jgi:hypothetical protein
MAEVDKTASWVRRGGGSADRGRRAREDAKPDARGAVSEFNVRGGLTFAGANGQLTGLYDTPKNNFIRAG